MKILAIDTSQLQASVCLIEFVEGKSVLLAFESGNINVAHSEAILPLVDSVLVKQKIELSGIDALAVGVGPGSFTGIRIGCATVKALAQVMEKPVIAFSSIQCLAKSGMAKAEEGATVVAMANAYQGLVFAGCVQNGQWVQEASDVESWVKFCAKTVTGALNQDGGDGQRREGPTIWFCGNGAKTYWSQINSVLQSLGISGKLISEVDYPSPHGVFETVSQMLKSKAFNVDPQKILIRYSELHAQYLRASQAEIKFSAPVAK